MCYKNLAIFICLFVSFKSFAGEYVLLVDKSKHKLSVLDITKDAPEVVQSYSVITGKKSGDKVMAGDNKTPEGIYFVTQTYQSSDLKRKFGDFGKKYGPTAFVLNYPNYFDILSNKTGSGIWIHGVSSDKRLLNAFNTEGCVALSNKDVISLGNYIEHHTTPIIIVDKIEESEIPNLFVQDDKYKNVLESWRNAWESKDFSTYAKYYSSHFQSKGKDKAGWINYKTEVSNKSEQNLSIQIRNPKMIEFKDQLVITFMQDYASAILKDEGYKFLYLQKEDTDYKILAEDFIPSISKWKNNVK